MTAPDRPAPRPHPVEPWAMDALSILARRLSPLPPESPASGQIIITTPPSRDPSWLDRIIEERTAP